MEKGNNEYRTITVSYLPTAEQDVYDMMINDIWSFMVCIKSVCQENNLDPYNFQHFSCAIEILKMKVSYN